MARREDEETFPGVPGNLRALLGAQHEGYQLRLGYVLELEHGLMGYFPAIIEGTSRQIASTDTDLIQQVWKMLSPRRSKMSMGLWYVNEQRGLFFPINGPDEYSLKESKPLRLFTRQEFKVLTEGGKNPFQWAPGLIGDDMNKEEFVQTLQCAAERHGFELY